MLIRIIAAVIIVWLAAIALVPIAYERIAGVGVMRMSTRSKRVRNSQRSRPEAEAYVVTGDSESKEPRLVVPIYSSTDIYASMGLGDKDFSQWLHRYGVTPSGKNRDGVLFVPDYPVFSKIAWMGINVIDLSSAETLMLIDECTRVRNRAVSAEASAELDALGALAQKAVATGGTIRFGLK